MSKSKKGFASRFALVMVAAVALGFLASQVYGYTVSRKTDNSGTQIYLLEDSGDLTIAGSLTAGTGQTITSGGLTVTAGGLTVTAGGLTVSDGAINLGSWSETIADGAVITNQAGVGILTGTSGGTTNTIANAGGAGEHLNLINNSAFPIVIAEAGNLSMAGNVTLGENDSIEFISTAAGEWVEMGRSDN